MIKQYLTHIFLTHIFLLVLISAAPICQAGNQKEEQLSNSVKALMQKSISDLGAPKLMFANDVQGQNWLAEMSARLKNLSRRVFKIRAL